MTTTGLRERKRLQTRRTLHETALKLFLERGFDHVTVAEVADEAGVALTTLFTYFPAGKVALVFEQDEDRALALVDAIQSRPAGMDALQAVEAFMLTRLPFEPGSKPSRDVLELIYSTPQLRAHVREKWTNCEDALLTELAEARRAGTPAGSDADADADAASLRALARFILEIPDVAARERSPRADLAMIFTNLRRGWRFDVIDD